MELIIGGAYQGKWTFARGHYGFLDSQVCDCALGEPDFTKPCLRHLEALVWRALERGEDPVAFFGQQEEAWKGSVLLCRDISGGIVPLDPRERRWREETGRLCQYLAAKADRVFRVFCGLAETLK